MLYYPGTRKTLVVYAMSWRLVEGPHLMWASVVCLPMGVSHNPILPLSVTVLAICLAALWQTHRAKGTQA